MILVLSAGAFVVVAVATLLDGRNSRDRTDYARWRTGDGHRPFDTEIASLPLERVALQGAAFVVDGDTLIICKTRVRLFGVDAPELNHPYGKKAKLALVSLCKGQVVRAEIVERDVHNRTVARCYLPDGRDLSAEMVKLGLAIDWAKHSGGEYRSLELPKVRNVLWLADARQKGRMHVWRQYAARQNRRYEED